MESVQASTRRSQRAQWRREEIVTTARSMFLALPYSQVSVESIAAALGISKVTIYSYFDSKLGIYCAILAADAQLLVEAFKEAFDPARDLASNLSRLGKAYGAFLDSHAEYFQRFSWYYLPGREQRLPREAGEAIGEKFSAAQGIIEQCLANASDRGEIPRRNFKLTAAAIYAQWLGLAYLRLANTKESGRATVEHQRIGKESMTLLLQGLGYSE